MENGYARPVEGIHVLVDIQNNVIIEFEDRKLVPLPPADPLRNYTAGETRGGIDRSDVKPLHILQPEGPSFRVNGYFVQWQKVFGILVISQPIFIANGGIGPIALYEDQAARFNEALPGCSLEPKRRASTQLT
ncbi:hypothetical protein BHM03_00012026 [Ensete ventricosum]|nr:hypothetical protein BHM03_00012026 [Ensete ventricosum]